MVDDKGVAVRDVGHDAPTLNRGEQLLQEAHRRRECGGADVRAETWVIHRDLQSRIDRVVEGHTRDAIHFVYVADALFWAHSAILAGPIRIDDNILWHCCSL